MNMMRGVILVSQPGNLFGRGPHQYFCAHGVFTNFPIAVSFIKNQPTKQINHILHCNSRYR